MMKKTFFLIVFLLSLNFVYSEEVIKADDSKRTISVFGESEIITDPQEVRITVGIETWDADILKAKEMNKTKQSKIFSTAEKYGIASKDIQTDFYNVEPRYEYYNDKSKFIGYFVRKSIMVNLKDVVKYENFITELLQNGIEYIQGVNFTIRDTKEYKDKARKMALEAARKKAEDMAAVLNQKVGKPIKISEEYADYWGSYSWWGGSSGRQTAMQNNIQVMGNNNSGNSGESAPGRVSIKARVSVTFEIY